MTAPSVTVLMTVYNGERYLAETIESILEQTFTDFRFLILDNASTDNSREIVRSYADPRIDLVALPENIGQARALNLGIEMIESPLIARIDADDIAEPTRLEKQVAAFEKASPQTAVIGTWWSCIDKDGQALADSSRKRSFDTPAGFLFAMLRKESCLSHPTVMMRTEIVKKIGGYDPAFAFAEDFDLWARLAQAGYGAQSIREPLLRYRIHDGQQSLWGREMQLRHKDAAHERLFRFYCAVLPCVNLKPFFIREEPFGNGMSFSQMRSFLKNLDSFLGNVRKWTPMNEKNRREFRQLTGDLAWATALDGGSHLRFVSSLPLLVFALVRSPGCVLSRATARRLLDIFHLRDVARKIRNLIQGGKAR